MITHDDFVDNIHRYRSDGVPMIPMKHLPKLSQYIAVGKGIYILLGGSPGSGKTSTVDSMFVINLFDMVYEKETEINVKWIYRSMERPTQVKYAKWVAHKLFRKYGFLLSVPDILSWPTRRNELQDEHIDAIKELEDYFEALFNPDTMLFKAGPAHPTLIQQEGIEFMERFGKLKKSSRGSIEGYEAEDEDMITIHVTDHLGRLLKERDASSKKERIDKHADNMALFRDIFGMTPIDIQQLNRSIQSDSIRRTKLDLDIQSSDFKDSGTPHENCDIMIGLLDPSQYSEVREYPRNGYDLIDLTDKNFGVCRYRSLKLIKNSYGQDDVRVGLNFVGECGLVRELPKLTEMDPAKYAIAANAIPPNQVEDFYHNYGQ